MGDGTSGDNRESTQLHSTDDDDLVVDNEQMGGSYKLRDSRYMLQSSMITSKLKK